MKSKLKYFIPAAILVVVFASLALAGCGTNQVAANPSMAAINTLRKQLELPRSPLKFIEFTTDGNSPTVIQVAVYQDADGRRYSVDPVTNQVIEMDARALLTKISPLASVFSEERVRAKAQRLMAAAIPGFKELQSSLVYEEGSKIDNYFFNWYGEMAAGMTNRPYAQIAIHRTGLVFGYYNSLTLDK